MSINGGWLVVLVTCSSRDEASKIARSVIGEKLAACVNIVEGIHSTYWWKGTIEEDEETLLIIKTRAEKFEKLVERIKELHSYTVPEIIALPIVMGNKDYLNWLDETIRQ